MDPASVRPGLDGKFFRFGGSGLGAGDETVVFHPLNDVELPRAGPFGVDDRVKSRGRLGQTGKHGRLRNRDVLERFSKISFGSRRKAIGTVTQKNLVHVDFENLVLGQQVLELEG